MPKDSIFFRMAARLRLRQQDWTGDGVRKWFLDIRKLADQRLFLLDVEGDGGIDGGTPVETSFIEIDGGRFVREHRWLTNPGVSIHPAARCVHGIDDGMVAESPRMEDVAADVVELIRGQTVVGLSVNNDLKMLRKKIPGIDFMIGRIVDVARISYLAPSGRKNMGLDNLCSDLGIETDPALMPFPERARRHGSSVDAWLTGKCLFALLARLKDAEPAVVKQASLAAFLQIPPGREKILKDELAALGIPVPTGRLP